MESFDTGGLAMLEHLGRGVLGIAVQSRGYRIDRAALLCRDGRVLVVEPTFIELSRSLMIETITIEFEGPEALRVWSFKALGPKWLDIASVHILERPIEYVQDLPARGRTDEADQGDEILRDIGEVQEIEADEAAAAAEASAAAEPGEAGEPADAGEAVKGEAVKGEASEAAEVIEAREAQEPSEGKDGASDSAGPTEPTEPGEANEPEEANDPADELCGAQEGSTDHKRVAMTKVAQVPFAFRICNPDGRSIRIGASSLPYSLDLSFDRDLPLRANARPVYDSAVLRV